MNRPIRTLDPTAVPCLAPVLSADGKARYDAVTFAYHILPRTNRLRGYVDLLPESQPTKPTRKRAARRPNR